jgi:hypothetical protein
MAEEVGQAGAYRVLTAAIAAIAAGDPETAPRRGDRVLRPATDSLVAAMAALRTPGCGRTSHEQGLPRGRRLHHYESEL